MRDAIGTARRELFGVGINGREVRYDVYVERERAHGTYSFAFPATEARRDVPT